VTVVFIRVFKGNQVKSSLIINATWQRLCEYLGLSEYEAKIYVSLIEAGQAKARTLSVMSGVPRTKVYSVLKKLMDLGFVMEVPGEPRMFSPAPPRSALEVYLQSYQERFQNLSSLISTLEKAFRKAKSRENMRRGSMWRISEKGEILKKIREMLSRAGKSVFIVTNKNGLVLLYKEFNKMFDELADRSVEIKIVVTDGPNNKHLLRELRYICNVEEKNFHLPLTILCADDRQVLMSYLQPGRFLPEIEEDKAIFSEDPIFCRMIRSLITQLTK